MRASSFCGLVGWQQISDSRCKHKISGHQEYRVGINRLVLLPHLQNALTLYWNVHLHSNNFEVLLVVYCCYFVITHAPLVVYFCRKDHVSWKLIILICHQWVPVIDLHNGCSGDSSASSIIFATMSQQLEVWIEVRVTVTNVDSHWTPSCPLMFLF